MRKSLASKNKNSLQGQILIPPALYQNTLLVGMPERSGKDIRSFPVNTIPTWFYMLIVSPGR
jgi:hypothetical protein